MKIIRYANAGVRISGFVNSRDLYKQQATAWCAVSAASCERVLHPWATVLPPVFCPPTLEGAEPAESQQEEARD